ncbi:hypothetical protein [Leifsonia sp. 22587]|uniref:hypothetical protein n=1 Tax=Leifsonia sp. 22587 TaxID=3453946 RepID=UPI003F829BB3
MTTELTHPDETPEVKNRTSRRGHGSKGSALTNPSKSRRQGVGRKKPDAEGADRVRATAPAGRTGGAFAVLPRVDLLPPEVKASRRNVAIGRRLLVALFVVVALVATAIGGSTVMAIQANSTLSAAQAETAALTKQQQRYAEVRAVESQIALTKAGQEVGASTEVDWQAFLTDVRAVTGGGLAITGITIDSASPLAAYQQSTVPLQGTRVATVTIQVKAPNLDVVSAWLSQLSGLPAVADVSPGAITLDGSGYTASAIMHLNESAFDGRFEQKGK